MIPGLSSFSHDNGRRKEKHREEPDQERELGMQDSAEKQQEQAG
jgi:hypothetical protein